MCRRARSTTSWDTRMQHLGFRTRRLLARLSRHGTAEGRAFGCAVHTWRTHTPPNGMRTLKAHRTARTRGLDVPVWPGVHGVQTHP